jgi:hypothetical protein
MKKSKLFLLFSFLSITLFSQTYQIGHKQVYFYDASRADREIQTEIYYPANVAGDDVAVASGQFPVLVFGHGFVMAWDSYSNFWEEFVPKGYIMVFPRTEGSMSPSHENFGLDLAFLADQLQVENLNSSSHFYGKVLDKTAVMGHSMGGGSSFIAAYANPNITTIVTFAAAETTPSAITYAANITMPAIVFSGSLDAISPADENQTPMYEALASNCKNFISVTGCNHCYFANYNFNCSLFDASATFDREEIHDVLFDFINIWFDYTLRDNNEAINEFNDSLQLSGRITYQQSCDLTAVEKVKPLKATAYPNPVEDILSIEIENTKGLSVMKIYNLTGEIVEAVSFSGNRYEFTTENIKQGIYLIQVCNNNRFFTHKIIKQ